MPYHVEVTPNPGLEPGRYVPVHTSGDPVVYPTEQQAEHVAEGLRENARKMGIGGAYDARVVPAP